MRRPLLLLLAPACAALALPAAAPAALRRPQPLVKVAPQVSSFPDRVITTGRITAHAASAARAYQAPDGTTIAVQFSAAYQEDPSVAQSYVDFLGSLPHGSELSKLKLLLAPPDEVVQDCGDVSGVLACYDGRTHQMVVPGEQISTSSGVSTSYVVTHEYGHHIAAYRTNAPFRALDWGPKYWASSDMVCTQVLDGRLAPGAEGTFYRENPGEGWAEVYARLTFPDQPWTFSPYLKPTALDLAAARQDVLAPWTGPVTRTFTGTFTAGGPKIRQFQVPLHLDGALKAALSGPRKANYDVSVSSLGQRRGITKAKGSRDVIKWTAACRQRATEVVTFTVVRRTGTGPFTLKVTYAG